MARTPDKPRSLWHAGKAPDADAAMPTPGAPEGGDAAEAARQARDNPPTLPVPPHSSHGGGTVDTQFAPELVMAGAMAGEAPPDSGLSRRPQHRRPSTTRSGTTWLAAVRAWRPSLLQGTLIVSLLLHVAVFAFRIIDPERFERVLRDTPLDVILVNARTDERPATARAIAQGNLAGGGEAAQGRATSPLPAAPQQELGDSPDESHRRVEQLAHQQQQMLAMIRREIATLPPPDPKRDEGSPQEREQEERRRQLLRQLAEIEKRINEDSEHPRRRYISPATREEAYALYYDALRRRIEDRGTRDFPVDQGRKLYGELTMNITVDGRGQVIEAEVVRSSGQRALDRRAVAIVRAAAPFGRFTSEMRKQADEIIVTSRFRFTRDDGLETTLSTNAGANTSVNTSPAAPSRP